MKPLLVYLKDMKVGSREMVLEKIMEWRQRNDREGEEQLGNSQALYISRIRKTKLPEGWS